MASQLARHVTIVSFKAHAVASSAAAREMLRGSQTRHQAAAFTPTYCRTVNQRHYVSGTTVGHGPLLIQAARSSSEEHDERPSLDDVERISKGLSSKAKIGSRQVPHRLNAEERKAYDLAKERGYVVIKPQTRYYPLRYTFRNFCDARAQPCIRIEQGTSAESDKLVVDLTTLRLPDNGLEEVVQHVYNIVQQPLSSGAQLTMAMTCPDGQESSSGESDADIGVSYEQLSKEEGLDGLTRSQKGLICVPCDRSTGRLLAKAIFSTWNDGPGFASGQLKGQ
eukprot:SM000015S01210  [mRNA]  locus=s15:512621:514244:- [translate_table: standard]